MSGFNTLINIFICEDSIDGILRLYIWHGKKEQVIQI